MIKLTFDIGVDPNNLKPINYIKLLLQQHSCLNVQKKLLSETLSLKQKVDAHTFWTEKGHIIRQRAKDDIKLEHILLNVLPRYCGKDVLLYRGENIERYKNRSIGFCWTTKLETAEMFARGLNSQSSGGILLQYSFSPSQIIAGPSQHSIYLGENEYTIAPSSIKFDEMLVLRKYSASL